MSRLSTDELAPDGTILNGFDYALQVWVLNGEVQPCGHIETTACIKSNCQAGIYRGWKVADIPGHEVRGEETP